MIVATCLGLATIIYITRWVSRPLLGLARGMHALAAHDTDISIYGTQRDDEIGEMARSVMVFRDTAIANKAIIAAAIQRRSSRQTLATSINGFANQPNWPINAPIAPKANGCAPIMLTGSVSPLTKSSAGKQHATASTNRLAPMTSILPAQGGRGTVVDIVSVPSL